MIKKLQNKMKKLTPNAVKKGFTMIEMIAVITIIGILFVVLGNVIGRDYERSDLNKPSETFARSFNSALKDTANSVSYESVYEAGEYKLDELVSLLNLDGDTLEMHHIIKDTCLNYDQRWDMLWVIQANKMCDNEFGHLLEVVAGFNPDSAAVGMAVQRDAGDIELADAQWTSMTLNGNYDALVFYTKVDPNKYHGADYIEVLISVDWEHLVGFSGWEIGVAWTQG